MQFFWLIVVFLIGSMVGSFLNVCIYRLPRDKSILRPHRSYCPFCHEKIAWYDNIPLVSWFMLNAQCRHCGSPISARYVAVEALTAVLFAVTYWLCSSRGEPVGVTAVYLALTGALIAGTFMDLELRIIPNVVTIGGMFVAPILSAAVPALHNRPDFGRVFVFYTHDYLMGPLAACAVGMIVGASLTWLSGLLGQVIFRREAMGLGDVKLMAMLGGLLGWQQVTLIFFTAAFIGAVVGIIHILRTKEHTMPFVPFLSLAALIVMHFADRMFELLFMFGGARG